MPDFLQIMSGFSVTSALFLARGDLGLTIIVPRSLNVGDLRLQCAQSSGASAAGDLFGDVQPLRLQSGPNYGPFTIFSGGGSMGPVYVPLPAAPTPFVRLASTTSQTMTVSFTVLAYRPN